MYTSYYYTSTDTCCRRWVQMKNTPVLLLSAFYHSVPSGTGVIDRKPSPRRTRKPRKRRTRKRRTRRRSTRKRRTSMTPRRDAFLGGHQTACGKSCRKECFPVSSIWFQQLSLGYLQGPSVMVEYLLFEMLWTTKIFVNCHTAPCEICCSNSGNPCFCGSCSCRAGPSRDGGFFLSRVFWRILGQYKGAASA